MSAAARPQYPSSPTSQAPRFRGRGVDRGPGSDHGESAAYRDRRPPYSEDAEQAVLAAMLMEQDAVDRAAELLEPAMFYGQRHRVIFEAALALSETGVVIDPLTLADALQRRGTLEVAGGKEFVGFLLDAVPTAANVSYHAAIVREKYLTRQLIEASTAIVADAFAGAVPIAELLDEAEARIFRVAEGKGENGVARLKELLWPTMERIEALQRGGQSVTGVPSGFTDLDEMTAGFQPADLVIVAARPSQGKTAITLGITLHAALEAKVPTAFFSLEMSKESLVQRMLCAEARIDAQRLRKGQLRDDDFPRLARVAGLLSTAPVYVDDTPALGVLEMRAKARRLKADAGIGLIVVDYLQLMNGPAGLENRQQEVSQISRGLKALAKELNVPVVALSQLSRAPEQRAGDEKGRPQLSDLRESGAIEQDADLILFLYRPEVYFGPTDKDGNSLEGRAEIIVGKQRNGPIGSVHLYFHKAFTRFENLTQRPTGNF